MTTWNPTKVGDNAIQPSYAAFIHVVAAVVIAGGLVLSYRRLGTA